MMIIFVSLCNIAQYAQLTQILFEPSNVPEKHTRDMAFLARQRRISRLSMSSRRPVLRLILLTGQLDLVSFQLVRL